MPVASTPMSAATEHSTSIFLRLISISLYIMSLSLSRQVKLNTSLLQWAVNRNGASRYTHFYGSIKTINYS